MCKSDSRPPRQFCHVREPGIYSFPFKGMTRSCTSPLCSHLFGQQYVTWLHLAARKPGICSLWVECPLLIYENGYSGELTTSSIPTPTLVHKSFQTRNWNPFLKSENSIPQRVWPQTGHIIVLFLGRWKLRNCLHHFNYSNSKLQTKGTYVGAAENGSPKPFGINEINSEHPGMDIRLLYWEKRAGSGDRLGQAAPFFVCGVKNETPVSAARLHASLPGCT